MSDSEEELEEVLSDPQILSKYQTAANVVNKAVAKVVSQLQPGASILKLAEASDAFILAELGTLVKKDTEKGIAFPTCISVNHVVGHFSPEPEDKDVLVDGDVVKIDVAAHVDGFIGSIAHTHIVSQKAEPTTGKQADVICAAHVAAEAVLRLLKPGAVNKDISAAIQQIADAYQVRAVEGVLSHQVRRYMIDAPKVILNKQTPDQVADEYEIEENDVFAIDIVMSSGEGKPKESERKPTVYKRAVDQNYMLKLAASRKIFTEISKKFPALPFSLRYFEDKKHLRFGLSELEKHGLIYPYPVLVEKAGDFVAQFKFTALVGSAGAKRITEHPLPYVSSEHAVEDASLKTLLSQAPLFATTGGGKKKKKSGSKKKKAAAKAEAKTAAPTTTTTTATTTTTTTTSTDHPAPMDTA